MTCETCQISLAPHELRQGRCLQCWHNSAQQAKAEIQRLTEEMTQWKLRFAAVKEERSAALDKLEAQIVLNDVLQKARDKLQAQISMAPLAESVTVNGVVFMRKQEESPMAGMDAEALCARAEVKRWMESGT